MHLLNSSGCVKNTCFLALLLTFSTNMQAEQSSAQPDAVSQAAQPGSVQPAPSGYHERQRTYNFPRWPERKVERREMVPPPPPGPYMSSALTLTGSGADSSPFTREPSSARPATRSGASMSTFSPDIPWPSISQSPNRWQPENGYHYVQPQVKNQPYGVTPSGYQNGYMRRAVNRSSPVQQRDQLYNAGGQSRYSYR